MRILHLDHGAGFGGAERSLLELALAQREAGHEPVIGVGRAGQLAVAAADAGLPVAVLGWPANVVDIPQRSSPAAIAWALPGVARAARALRAEVRRSRPDVVHAHTRKAQLIAALTPRPRTTSLVWHLRDDLPAGFLLRAAIRLAARRADHAVALSAWMVAQYRAAGVRPSSRRIGRIPSGVRTTELRALPTPWLDGARPPVVGYVGQIAHRKGCHLLVEAAELLADQADARFLLIGDVSFPRAEGAYGAWLRDRIARSPAAARIGWLPPTARPEEAFEALDVLVLPNVQPEPLGRILVEAMASRRPIVAVAHGATVELLDAESAVLVPAASAALVAAGIRDVLRDPAADPFEPAAVARRMDEEYRFAR